MTRRWREDVRKLFRGSRHQFSFEIVEEHARNIPKIQNKSQSRFSQQAEDAYIKCGPHGGGRGLF
jgi:hypothetical protein